MSSRVEKYKAVIAHKKEMHKPCDLLYVCKLSNDKENAFLVQDMFPITEKYILRPYTFAGNPLKMINETDRQIIESKAIRILNLIERKVPFNKFQPDVLKIKETLLEELAAELTTV